MSRYNKLLWYHAMTLVSMEVGITILLFLKMSLDVGESDVEVKLLLDF